MVRFLCLGTLKHVWCTEALRLALGQGLEHPELDQKLEHGKVLALGHN